MSTEDQNTIGLSPAAAANLESLMESSWFDSELDACRVAMAIALSRNEFAPKSELVSLKTKYNIGTYDRDNQVRQLLSMSGVPQGLGVYEYAERLIHSGLRILAEELSVEGALLADSISRPE